MIDLETKRKRIETGVKVAALLGVCAIVAPFTYAILGVVLRPERAYRYGNRSVPKQFEGL